MSFFSVVWLILTITVLIFEFIAILNKDKGDTISEYVWAWLKKEDSEQWWIFGKTKLRRFLFLALWAWLTFHFFSGGWV